MLSRALEETIALPHLAGLSGAGFVSRRRSSAMAAHLASAVRLKACNIRQPCAELSGGNQQQVLFARALGSSAPVILMDDPMRGVDIGTKQEVYAILRQEADAGRTFVWYSTEMDEVCLCDRVYVFNNGMIVAELKGDEVTEENILSASFQEAA